MNNNKLIVYGKLRFDETFQYRHVRVTDELAIVVGDGHKLTYSEWKGLGIKLPAQWEHVSTHIPERNVLLFRMPVERKKMPNSEHIYQNEYEIEKYASRQM